MDNCCDIASSVAAGAGEQLHHGRVHPYFACDRNCCSVGTSHSGEKNNIDPGRRETWAKIMCGKFPPAPLLLFARVAE